MKKHADDLVQPLAVDGQARVARVAESFLGLFEGCRRRGAPTTFRRGTIASRTSAVGEVEDAVNQPLLVGLEVAALVRRLDELAQLLRGVDRAVVGRGVEAEEPDGARRRPSRAARMGQLKRLVEKLHRPGRRPARPFRPAQAPSIFGASSPSTMCRKVMMREGDGERDDVERRSRRRGRASGTSSRCATDGLADPAEGERGERDAELRGRDVGVEVVEQPEQARGAAVAGGGQCARCASAARRRARTPRRRRSHWRRRAERRRKYEGP